MLEIEELITLPELEKCCPIQPRFKLDIPNRKGGGGVVRRKVYMITQHHQRANK